MLPTYCELDFITTSQFSEVRPAPHHGGYAAAAAAPLEAENRLHRHWAMPLAVSESARIEGPRRWTESAGTLKTTAKQDPANTGQKLFMGDEEGKLGNYSQLLD